MSEYSAEEIILNTATYVPRVWPVIDPLAGDEWRDEASATIYLLCQPIRVATQINAFNSSFEHSGMVIPPAILVGSLCGALIRRARCKF